MLHRIALALAVITLIGLVPATAQSADDYQGDPYTAGVCAVSGEKLGSMGDPILYNHEGRDIRFCCAGCKPRFSADPAKFLSGVDAKMVEQQLPHYPLDTDVVSGEPLPEDGTIDVIHNNRLVRFADQRSLQKFFQNPAKYIAKLDEAVIEKQLPAYPTDKCVVSGEPLTAMGEPIQKVYANQLVQFCCAGCVDAFWAEPNKYLSMLHSGEMAEGGEHKGHDEGSDHK